VVNSEQYFEVDHIVHHYPRKATNEREVTHYLIKWQGYPGWENTREPASKIRVDAPDVVRDYWLRVQRDNVKRAGRSS
jgi:hypothetical protein